MPTSIRTNEGFTQIPLTFAGTALTLEGAVTMDTTLAVTGASTLTGAVTCGTTLAVTGVTTLTGQLNANGAVVAATTLGVTGTTTLTGALAANGNASMGNAAADLLAFHDGTPTAQQDITGSKGANAALTSLLTALAAIGLVTDSSS